MRDIDDDTTEIIIIRNKAITHKAISHNGWKGHEGKCIIKQKITIL